MLDSFWGVADEGTAIGLEVVRGTESSTVRMRSVRQSAHPREREVLELMAQSRSNAAIAQRARVSEEARRSTIENLLMKLDLPLEVDGHRRVLAVLAYLRE